METGMIVISTILIVICTLPFILMNKGTKKRKKQFKKHLEASISEDNGVLTEYVINNNFALGIDNSAKQIYYYKKTSEADYFQKINLNNINTCEVKKDTKLIKNGKSSFEQIQRISLVFTFTKSNIIEKFEFYDYDDSFRLSDEIVLADTWKTKVMDLLVKDSANLKELENQKVPVKFA